MRTIPAAVLFFASLSPVLAGVELTGFFVTQSETLCSFQDTTDQASSEWIKVGERFKGYTLISFDSVGEVATLRSDHETVQLHLRASKVKDGEVVTGVLFLAPNRKLEGVKASLVFNKEAVFPVENGITLHLKATLMQDGNIWYHSYFVIPAADGKTSKVEWPDMVARPGQKFLVFNGEMGYEFNP